MKDIMTILTSYDSKTPQTTLTVQKMMEIVIIRIKATMGALQLQFFTSIKCKRLFQSHSFLLKFDGKVDTAISVG